VNAAGLTAVLNGVIARLKMPFYQSIVTNGSVSQDEFDGTLGGLIAVEATLKKTPGPKIEAMVDRCNAELTTYLNKFNGEWSEHPLQGFHHAQMLAGYITTIMAKSGLHE
jgi:hypothetical protein